MFRLEKRCELYHQWRKEAEQACAHMDDAGKHAWAMFNVRNHPDAKFRIRIPWRIVIQVACGIFLLLLGYHCHAQAITPIVGRSQIVSPLDGSGNVKVNCMVGCTAGGGGSAITTWGGGTLGAMAAYGTSPGAVLVPGVNAFITNVPHVVCDSGCASGGSSTPADTFANPTTAGLGMSFPMVWNGTSWDRQYGDKTNGLFVNVKTSVLPTGAALDSSLTTLDTDLKANVTLHAGTNVIGHVIADTGSTTAVTGNVAVTNAGLSNIDVLLSTRTKPADQQHAIIDSGTTVVTQGTGTNLHAVVDSGAVNATLGAETTKVIGTVRLLGNAGSTLDAAPAAALPTNVQVIAGRDSTQTGGGTAVPVVCDKSAAITATAVGSVVVIALAASKTTYICGFVITGAGAAGTMQWKSGTGTTCGTGTANLTGAMATAIGGTVSYGTGFGTIMRHASAAQDTCITMATTSATAAGVVSYAQF